MSKDQKPEKENNVGDSISAPNARWTFSGGVAEYFHSHVKRSIPFYHDGHDLILKLSDFFMNNGSLVYDLGCSTGSLTRQLAIRSAGKSVRIIGIDNEPEMVKKVQKECLNFPNVAIQEADIIDFAFEPTDLIISFYTIQFVRPRYRQQLFNEIYNALNWGGGFLLFEKVRAPDARFQDIMTSLYEDYKLDQGFSEVEIMNKARSLKGILEPFSTQGNIDLLKRAGFVDFMTVFKYICFEGFLAIK